MPSCRSNAESTYLGGILVASIIVVIVIVEGEINYRSRTGDDLPDGGEVIVVGIGHCCLLLGIGRATGRERPADYREALKSTVMHQTRRVHRRKIEASATERYSV